MSGDRGSGSERGGARARGTPEGLHRRADAVYLPTMDPRDLPGCAKGLLEFKPWMLALAVFLACALGIAVMEQFREAQSEWAQVTAQDPR